MAMLAALGAFWASPSAALAAEEPVPSGALQRGSLANERVINEARLAIARKINALGCSQPERAFTYIMAMPAGPTGQRQWRELWVVKGCSTSYPINIEFTENGPNDVKWTLH